MSLTDVMPEIVDHPGAQLVHPAKAYLLRHLDPAEQHVRRPGERTYLSRGTTLTSSDPEVSDYVLRLTLSVETLFGSMELDVHCTRQYKPDVGLEFHQDLDEPDLADDLIRMVTCIHNVAEEDRTLTFRKPLWTGHTESFDLPIPAGAILAFGESLITDYEHGIPPSPDVEHYRSVVTRFALWKESDDG